MTNPVLATLTMIALLGTGAAQASLSSPAAPVPARQLTHKQAMYLLNNASTPDDHRKLAQYFRQEAQRKRAKEEYYRETAATYRLHPLRVDATQNVSTADRYRHWADEAQAAALADDQKAILQEKLAEGLTQSK